MSSSTQISWGVTTLRVLDLLEQIGPMTRSELSQRLGIDRQNLASVMSRLTKPSLRPAGPRRVHIGGWQDDGAPGERRYLRAIYALGDKPDKRRPASSKERQLEAKRAYWHRRKGRATTSVFALGQVGLGR